MSAPATRWRSPLLSGAMPSAKRHGSETGYHYASPTSALATIAPVCHHLLLSCSDNACGARNDPAIALCAMPHHQTHVGRTQGIPLSATSVWEPLCGRMREHGRVMLTYLHVTLVVTDITRPHASWSRRVRGARAATTTTAVAGRVPVVGRVPSGPLGGRTGTAGPADCDSTFMSHILAQRAGSSVAAKIKMASRLRVISSAILHDRRVPERCWRIRAHPYEPSEVPSTHRHAGRRPKTY